MFTIGYREFINSFKSIKSLLTIITMISLSYAIAYYSDKYISIIYEEFNLTSLASLLLVMLILGFLFVFSISHDTFSREIHSRTARFLVTKTNRDTIVIGKFLGIMFFWIACIVIATILLITITMNFSVEDFFQIIVFITYPITFCILISIIFSRPGYSMFIGLFAAIAIPAVSFWSISSNNIFIGWLKYFTPYYYAYEGGYKHYFILILSAILLVLSVILFRRKEL
ncbi:ABC transporter permease subunit [Oceanobacillus sp. 143]|uniref:ABC transporter permease n=1 Tax=Oceanobacillus zhaokaii TaxID=2052660 RepID=A0A345PCE7_9BACI|nr:ABC transporter permease subunit [Oceanobacillus zhaokaii]AXI07677.1 hypothetical protein CUC15_01125 [Oceanobacillus zhaokaii]QGS67857.1 ABC transporter permease subunit [Oceanobacillus sp. 143]